MIIGFNENSEAFIDTQYPDDLFESLNINIADLTMLHSTNKKEPNFFQMEIADFSVASFFTGFSPGRYVGRPNYAITVFLETEEFEKVGIPKDFEGLLRRIAHIILPKKDNNPDFDDMFKEFFLMLENEDLEPYWEESEEEEIPILSEVSAGDVTKEELLVETSGDEQLIKEEISEEKVSQEIDSELKTKIIEELESYWEDEEFAKLSGTSVRDVEEVSDEELLDEPSGDEHVIEEVVNEEEISEEKASEVIDSELKVNMIEELESGIPENHLEKLEKEVLEEEIKDLKTQFNEKTEKIKELTRIITEFQTDKAEIEEIKEADKSLKESINKLTEEKEELERNINELKKELEDRETRTDELNQEIEKLKKENEDHLDRIASLKIELRDLTSKDDKVQDNLTEELIDMKKELKVLRRERDHYKKIVKDNDLL
jgi:exonuclease SbcC